MRKKCKVWLLLTACSGGRTCPDSETVFRDPRQQLFQKSARTNFCPSQNPNRLDKIAIQYLVMAQKDFQRNLLVEAILIFTFLII